MWFLDFALTTPRFTNKVLISCTFLKLNYAHKYVGVTDVTGATVGIEREGLQAICPGSRFEKGLQRWWHVQENGKYFVRKDIPLHCKAVQLLNEFLFHLSQPQCL